MSMVACTCRIFSLALILGSAAFGQMFSAGVRGGIPFGSDGYRSYTVGPTVEFKPPIIPLRFVGDALYKRTDIGGRVSSVWDIPLMVRLEMPTPILKPFIMGGPLWRRVDLLNDSDTQTGFTTGAGLRITAPFVKITPEFRFSHVGDVPGRGSDNMGEFLIGITF
jgi:hypothetical protein